MTQLCRTFCFDFPFCVSIKKNIYGVEDGVEIDIINYARFKRTKEELSVRLANKNQSQWSYTIMTPDKNVWFSRRTKEPFK